MLQQGEIHALREAAERAWDDDTRDEFYAGHPDPSLGQCYNTSRWLQDRMGGAVGTKEGHYFWVSPDRKHALDLTADQFGGSPMTYKPTDHHLFQGFRVADNLDDDGTSKFIKRANREFDNLGKGQSKVADLIGDSHPGQEPQADEDRRLRYFHKDDPGRELSKGEYNFLFANGRIEVSPFHDHKDLAKQIGLDDSEMGTPPLAVGYISVDVGMAHWSVQSNVGAKALSKVLREYTEHVGWKWGGMTDLEGEPVGTGSEFAPKNGRALGKDSRFVFSNGHLTLMKDQYQFRSFAASQEGSILYGRVEQNGDSYVRLLVDGAVNLPDSTARPVLSSFLDALHEYADDEGITLLSGNDNVIKRIEDLELDNLYSPEQNQDDQPFFPNPSDDHPERGQSGLYRCPYCDVLRPTWQSYTEHIKDSHDLGDFEWGEEDGKFPDSQMGDEQGSIPSAHFDEQQPAVFPVASVTEARRVDGFKTLAKAFGFDNDNHRHYVAFQYGSPVGWATLDQAGTLRAFRVNRPVASSLWRRVLRDYGELTVKETHLDEPWLKNAGFTQVNADTWRWAKGQDPKDLLEAEVPFIYDVQADTINIGQPGQRTSDIAGQFTPGGIVEGTYEPGGKVTLRTMTNMPYTVRHMIELWYAQHPQLEVTNIFKNDDGNEQKLASQDLGKDVQSIALQDHAAREATQALLTAGGNVYAVGGAVRDTVMGKVPHDIDLMVQGVPKEKVGEILKALPGRVDYTGKDFGVFRYRSSGGSEVEIALPRVERSTGDAHTDFDVQADHTLAPEQDLYRRDFTANAMAVDLATGQLIDPYDGVGAIARNELRTVHEHSLAEDPLRVARALGAYARHGFEPTEGTRAQMVANAGSLDSLSRERVQMELDKIMASPNPAGAMRLAHETGVLPHLLPEVEAAQGFDQNNPHHERELGDHLFDVLDRTTALTDDPDVRMAALLHDIGKPGSAWEDPETGSFHYYRNALGQGENHEELGADMARDRLTQLRYPKERVQRITDLVRNHMYAPFTTPRGARRFLNRVGDHANDLLDIREADNGGKSYGNTGKPDLNVDNERDLLNQVRQGEQPTQRSQLAVNGNDLIQMGIPPGPQIGQVLEQLTNAVVDDPDLNDKETLLKMVGVPIPMNGNG